MTRIWRRLDQKTGEEPFSMRKGSRLTVGVWGPGGLVGGWLGGCLGGGWGGVWGQVGGAAGRGCIRVRGFHLVYMPSGNGKNDHL